jgi:hypothetical protein
MTDRNLRTLVAGLTGVLVVVVALALLVVVGRNGPATASRSPSQSAAASGSPSSAAASSSPSASAAATPSAPPSEPASVAPSAGASSSPLPSGVATMTFIGLKLDGSADPAGKARIIRFTSDGPVTVTAKLASTSPQGTTHMCLLIGTKEVACKDLASGTFTGKTTQAHANWQVTLIGSAIETPTVDLTLTFQAVAPSVTIEHARFDGTAFPDTNGIQARFTARTPGNARLVANWGGHPFLYEVDLFDETSGSGDQTFANQGPSTNVDQSIPVTAGNWRMVLQNVEAGFGVTDLTATISWP